MQRLSLNEMQEKQAKEIDSARIRYGLGVKIITMRGELGALTICGAMERCTLRHT